MFDANSNYARTSLPGNFPPLDTEPSEGCSVDPRLLRRLQNFQATHNQGMRPLPHLNQFQMKIELPEECNASKFHGYTREDQLIYTLAMMKLQQKSLPNLDNCGKPNLKCTSQDQRDQGYNTQDTSSVGTVESMGQQGTNNIDFSSPNSKQEVRRTVKQIENRAHGFPEFVTIKKKVGPSKQYLPHDDSDVYSTSSDDDNNNIHSPEIYGDFVVSEDDPLQSSAVNGSFGRHHLDATEKSCHRTVADDAEEVESLTPKRLRYSAGNEPDPFVKFYTVRLHGRGNPLTARSVLTLAHFVKAFGGPPKTMTYNSLGNVVIQVEDEDQGSILSRTTSMGGFDIETKPHSTLNNVTGIVVSERLWEDGSSAKVVQQLAHEGVISATIFDPIILQDGTVLLAIEITFGNRSSLPISVKTLSGHELDVRVRVVPPKQCLNCFRFGHETQQCRELDAICENCSNYRDYHLQPCKRLTRCANCGSLRHGALSRHCFALYKAWRVNIVAFTEGVAFMEAKRQVDDEVEDCQTRGGDYVKEFPLTSRYFLIVSQEQLKSSGAGRQTNSVSHHSTARPVITSCCYPEMFTIADPGEYMNCSQLIDYYSTNDLKVGVVQSQAKKVAPRSPSAYRSSESRWSLPTKLPLSLQRPSLLKKQVAPDDEKNNYLPYQDPVGMSPPSCRNSSYESTDELLDPMPLLIHVVNRFSLKILNVELLIKADSPVGLVKFCAINLRCVSCYWQEHRARSTLNFSFPVIKREKNGSGTAWIDDHHDFPVIKRETTVSGTAWNDDHHGNRLVGKLVEGDTFDDCTDVYAASRCKRFVRGRECSENCDKIHRLPKEDGIRCISMKLGQCLYGRQCNFLHDRSDEDNEPVAIRDVQGCDGKKDRNYDDNSNYDYGGTGAAGIVDAGGGVYYDGRSSSSSEDDDCPSTAMAVGPLLGLFNRCKN